MRLLALPTALRPRWNCYSNIIAKRKKKVKPFFQFFSGSVFAKENFSFEKGKGFERRRGLCYNLLWKKEGGRMLDWILEQQDVWQRLQSCRKPVVLYGMGTARSRFCG